MHILQVDGKNCSCPLREVELGYYLISGIQV